MRAQQWLNPSVTPSRCLCTCLIQTCRPRYHSMNSWHPANHLENLWWMPKQCHLWIHSLHVPHKWWDAWGKQVSLNQLPASQTYRVSPSGVMPVDRTKTAHKHNFFVSYFTLFKTATSILHFLKWPTSHVVFNPCRGLYSIDLQAA